MKTTTRLIHHVDSSAISAMAYSARTGELSVWFNSRPNAEYVYVKVPLFLVGAIFKSRSRGKALNRWIIGKTSFTKKEDATWASM